MPKSMLTPAIKASIDQCVLCWLATTDVHGQANVSPKELFTYLDDAYLGIAHIASPRTLRNLKVNPKACLSFVNIFVQKGYKLYGEISILPADAPTFAARASKLLQLADGKFPIQALLEFRVTKVMPIIAPSYLLYPDTTTEETQVAAAMRTYGVRKR